MHSQKFGEIFRKPLSFSYLRQSIRSQTPVSRKHLARTDLGPRSDRKHYMSGMITCLQCESKRNSSCAHLDLLRNCAHKASGLVRFPPRVRLNPGAIVWIVKRVRRCLRVAGPMQGAPIRPSISDFFNCDVGDFVGDDTAIGTLRIDTLQRI